MLSDNGKVSIGWVRTQGNVPVMLHTASAQGLPTLVLNRATRRVLKKGRWEQR